VRDPVCFDRETVAVLRQILDDAWSCLPPEQRTNTPKSVLAERILKSAAQGERDRERLLEAALSAPLDDPITIKI
jgi:hypothetical protein